MHWSVFLFFPAFSIPQGKLTAERVGKYTLVSHYLHSPGSLLLLDKLQIYIDERRNYQLITIGIKKIRCK